MTTWDGAPAPPAARIGVAGWILAAARGGPIGAVVFGGLALLLAVRAVERPLHGLHRPWTPWITVAVCRAALALLGLRRDVTGAPDAGAVVANHVSWLDIFVLNAGGPTYFVAKSEVASWPGIGWLARATGTVFVVRAPREAAAQRAVLQARLAAGHRLCFFPEGTSTDGRRVLPFKTTLFAAFLSDGPVARTIQGASLAYHAPPGAPAAFYGWWGAMGFAESLARTLAVPRHGRVAVTYGPPRRAGSDRKALARALEADVRSALAAEGIAGAISEGAR